MGETMNELITRTPPIRGANGVVHATFHRGDEPLRETECGLVCAHDKSPWWATNEVFGDYLHKSTAITCIGCLAMAYEADTLVSNPCRT